MTGRKTQKLCCAIRRHEVKPQSWGVTSVHPTCDPITSSKTHKVPLVSMATWQTETSHWRLWMQRFTSRVCFPDAQNFCIQAGHQTSVTSDNLHQNHVVPLKKARWSSGGLKKVDKQQHRQPCMPIKALIVDVWLSKLEDSSIKQTSVPQALYDVHTVY